MTVACPHCMAQFVLNHDVPPLPEALGCDCSHCRLYFVVWRKGDEIRVSAATRNGQAST